jgi:hypothetical protein
MVFVADEVLLREKNVVLWLISRLMVFMVDKPADAVLL